MTIITPDQIFDLFAVVSCKRDLNEIVEYIQDNLKSYCLTDLLLFNQCMATLWEVFNLAGI